MAAPPSSSLQRMLQTAVQSVQWTYSLFWHLCPQQGILVWGDGYYNGAIKTRKTIQPMEVSAEEASLQRSQQLRELYESLSAGGSLGEPSGQQVRRPCAALSPEDLTESEWFYLMCVSFSFPPGVGLPGKAYAKRRHVWLTGANEVDSKLFTRAILAKSARVQTVLCIPLLDGVVEFGITEKVQEDLALVQHLNTFFNDYQKGHHLPPPKPALSEQSTSNPVNSSDQVRFHSPPLPALYIPVQDQPEEDEDVDDEEEDDEEEDEEEEEEEDEGDGSEVEANNLRAAEVVEPSELMQLEMSEDIRLGSPDEVSNHLESDFQLLGMGTAAGAVGNSTDDQIRVDSFRTELARRWPLVHDQSLGRGNLIPQHDDDPSHGLEIELMHEDTHYSQTVSTILNHQSNRWSDLSPSSSSLPGLILPYSSQSSFFKWTNRSDLHHNSHSKSQSSLKYILFTIPQLHTKGTIREDNSSSPRGGGDPTSRLRKSVSQDELSASHVMAERRRREKLNERFIILRSLVPFVTKMDKASILGDTIEYVKQLRNKIHDLESDTRKSEPDQQRSRSSGDLPQITSSNGQSQNLMIKTGSDLRAGRVGVSAPPVLSDKRKMRMVETSGGSVIRSKVVDSPPDLSPPAPPPPPPQPAPGVTLQVQVSIIENDGLVELQCPYREGLLLDVMVTLRELGVDIVTVQSSLTNGIFVAKMRAKVKENANGRKASITEVKRAINKIIPQS